MTDIEAALGNAAQAIAQQVIRDAIAIVQRALGGTPVAAASPPAVAELVATRDKYGRVKSTVRSRGIRPHVAAAVRARLANRTTETDGQIAAAVGCSQQTVYYHRRAMKSAAKAVAS